MKRTGIVLAVIFALGIIVGGLGYQRLSEPERSLANCAGVNDRSSSTDASV